MASFLFSTGKLLLKSSDDQAHEVGTLQGVTLSFKAEKKELFGQNRFAVATASGHQSIEGKADFATFDGRLMAAVLGGSVATGRSIFYTEALTIAAQAVQATNTTGFEHFGIRDASGNPMVKVAATPALHEFTVTAGGLYGFNASESGTVTINYRYTVSTGFTATGSNTAMGTQTHFVGVFQGEFDNAGTVERFGCELYAVAVDGLDQTYKSDDFSMANLSFSASANSAGTVYKLYYE